MCWRAGRNMSLWVLLFIHFPPGHSVRKPRRNLDVVINDKCNCVCRRVLDTLRENDTHGDNVQELCWTVGWWTNQRKRSCELWTDLAPGEKATVVHLLCFLIPIKVSLRVERLPAISHLNCTTRQSRQNLVCSEPSEQVNTLRVFWVCFRPSKFESFLVSDIPADLGLRIDFTQFARPVSQDIISTSLQKLFLPLELWHCNP